MTTQSTRDLFFKFLENLGESAWQYNLETQEIRTSATFWKALGYAADFAPASRDAGAALVHPTDLQLAAEEVELHSGAHNSLEFELRVHAANGEWRFIRIRGSAIQWNATGGPSVIAGILVDVTDQVVAAQKQFRAEDLIATLSNRERQVLGCLIAGAANKNIAHELGLSQRTVEAYRARMMDKLGVRGATELIKVAIEGGLTRDGSQNIP